jgi:hypothetical protein
VRSELARGLPLIILFVVGMIAGIWVFLAPWTLGYPTATGWTSSVWTSVWVGGILTVASAVSVVAVLARSLHQALLPRPDGR